MPKTCLIYTNIDYKYLLRVLEVGLTVGKRLRRLLRFRIVVVVRDSQKNVY